MSLCLRCGCEVTGLRVLCPGCKRVMRAADQQRNAPQSAQQVLADRAAEREAMRRRLALVRAERTAKQRRAAGLPA